MEAIVHEGCTKISPLEGATSAGGVEILNKSAHSIPSLMGKVNPLDTPILQAVRELATFAPVIPLHTVIGGICTCQTDCGNHAGKHPTRNGWQKAATSDPAIISKWLQKWPNCNWGFVLGRKSRLVALDMDTRDGGDQTLAQLEAEHGPIPFTVVADTGGGGAHRFFEWPGRKLPKQFNLGPGLHLLADGALSVAPYSRHKSGGVYRWRPTCEPWNAPVAKLPTWILDQLPSEEEPPSKPTAHKLVIAESHNADADLAAYRELVPSLQSEGAKRWRACCPLHDDETPSFTVSLDPTSGKWHWRCWGTCDGSKMTRTAKGGAAENEPKHYHHGDIRDLQTLLNKKAATTRAKDAGYYLAAEKSVRAKLPARSMGLRLALAIIKHAAAFGLDLMQPLSVSYRVLAEIDPLLDQVREDNSLAQRGRRIWKGRKELASVGVETAETAARGKRTRGTGLYNMAPLLEDACASKNPLTELMSRTELMSHPAPATGTVLHVCEGGVQPEASGGMTLEQFKCIAAGRQPAGMSDDDFYRYRREYLLAQAQDLIAAERGG